MVQIKIYIYIYIKIIYIFIFNINTSKQLKKNKKYMNKEIEFLLKINKHFLSSLIQVIRF
jgi:hypothetical protein